MAGPIAALLKNLSKRRGFKTSMLRFGVILIKI
jgi:hypothetical protein